MRYKKALTSNLFKKACNDLIPFQHFLDTDDLLSILLGNNYISENIFELNSIHLIFY